SAEIHELVDRVMEREQPQVWRVLPPQLRARIHRRVDEQLPEVIPAVVDDIDELLDPKLMVIRHIEANPELANRVFESVGEKELKLIINLGFVFGFIF